MPRNSPDSPATASQSLLPPHQRPVVLLFPPVASPLHPPLSLPVLAASLRQASIPVACLDVNLAFFRWLNGEERQEIGLETARSRLSHLAGQKCLHFAEAAEAGRLVNILDGWQAQQSRSPSPRKQRETDPARRNFSRAGIRVASAASFPESVEIGGYFFRLGGSPFASESLHRAATAPSLSRSFLAPFLAEQLAPLQPLLVGISIGFPDQAADAFACAQLARQLLPTTHVTLGGPWVSRHLRHLTDTDQMAEPALLENIDSLVLDAGEIPLGALWRELASPRPNLESVPGLRLLVGRGTRRKIHAAPPAETFSLDRLPLPAYDALPLTRYLHAPDRLQLPVRLGTGCTWGRCAFCQNRLPSEQTCDQIELEPMVEHLQELQIRTGIRRILLTDNYPTPRLLAAWAEILVRRKANLRWTCHTRFHPRLDTSLAGKLLASGCEGISLGLEAWNDRLLRLIRKGASIRLMRRVLVNLARAGLPVVAYVILGLPTETRDEALAAHQALTALRSEGLLAGVVYHPFQLAPFSLMHEQPESFGIRGVTIPPGWDLAPPVFRVTGTGMEREDIFHLGEYANPWPRLFDPGPSNAALGQHLQAGQPDIFFDQWLAANQFLDYIPARGPQAGVPAGTGPGRGEAPCTSC